MYDYTIKVSWYKVQTQEDTYPNHSTQYITSRYNKIISRLY